MKQREIKFRAWLQKSKKMMYIESTLEQLLFEDGHYYNYNGTDEKPIFTQYTGRKDKNGKEIYFSDIIQWHTNWLVSQNGEDKTCKAVVEWSKTGQCWFPCINSTSEVIGNIYENPELLK